MTYTLSSQQSAQWIEGNWLAYEVEETVLEDLDRAGIHEPHAGDVGHGRGGLCSHGEGGGSCLVAP